MKTPEEVKERTHWVINAVLHELGEAYKQYPDWPKDSITAAAIVSEEAGELLQSALDVQWHNLPEEEENMVNECIQTAAMAVRFLVEHTGH